MEAEEIDLRGVRVLPGFLGPDAQAAMVADLREVARAAPVMRPVTRRGPQVTARSTRSGADAATRRCRSGWGARRGTGRPSWPPAAT